MSYNPEELQFSRMENNLVTEAVLACVKFGNRRLTDPRGVAALIAIRNSLATVFITIARGIASHPKYSKWKADEANPGYLVTTFRSRELRAPWNVVGDLPGEDELDEFLDLASTVKFGGDSVVCLSGSVLARSTVKAASDIDLCEYVSAADGDFSDVARQAISAGGSNLICLQVSAHTAAGLQPEPTMETLKRPWSAHATETFLGRVAPATTGKCDYAVRSKSEGTVEMTKIVLRVDARYTDTEGAWELSFPYQELGVGTGSWVPRRLASPPAIGRYVVWLFRQVQAHADTAPTKAAKRALSLARILNVSELANAALQVLEEDDLALKAALKARVQLLDRMIRMEDPALEPFCAQLDEFVTKSAQGLGIMADHFAAGGANAKSVWFGELVDSLNKSTMEAAGLGALSSEFGRILEPSIQMGRY